MEMPEVRIKEMRTDAKSRAGNSRDESPRACRKHWVPANAARGCPVQSLGVAAFMGTFRFLVVVRRCRLGRCTLPRNMCASDSWRRKGKARTDGRGKPGNGFELRTERGPVGVFEIEADVAVGHIGFCEGEAIRSQLSLQNRIA